MHIIIVCGDEESSVLNVIVFFKMYECVYSLANSEFINLCVLDCGLRDFMINE